MMGPRRWTKPRRRRRRQQPPAAWRKRRRLQGRRCRNRARRSWGGGATSRRGTWRGLREGYGMRGHVGRVWIGSAPVRAEGLTRRPRGPRMVRRIAGGRADDFDGDGRWRRRPSGEWKTGEGGWAGSLEESRAAALVKSSDGLAYAFGWRCVSGRCSWSWGRTKQPWNFSFRYANARCD